MRCPLPRRFNATISKNAARERRLLGTGRRSGNEETEKWGAARGHRETESDEGEGRRGWIKTFLFLLCFPRPRTARPSLKRHCFTATRRMKPGGRGRYRMVDSLHLSLFAQPCARLSRNYFSPRTGETRTVSEIGQTSALTKYKLLDRK